MAVHHPRLAETFMVVVSWCRGGGEKREDEVTTEAETRGFCVRIWRSNRFGDALHGADGNHAAILNLQMQNWSRKLPDWGGK